MKKIQMILIVFVMLVGLTLIGCSKTNSNDGTHSNDSNDSTTSGESDEDTQGSKETVIDTKNFAIIVDNQLKGIDLIRAAKITNPVHAITYDLKTVIGSGETVYETVGKVIKSGQSYRTETNAQGEGVEVTIYNSDEKMTYKYFEARKEGYKYQDDESSGEGPTIADEHDLTMSYIDETNLAKAEVIQYEGEPVMYFEILEGNNRVASWISLRYGITIKTEMYDGDNLVSQTVINNITLPASINPSNFVPPSDVAFEDYSASSLNEEQNMPLDELIEEEMITDMTAE